MTANNETFSQEELETYLSYIKYDGNRDPNMENLKKLMLCNLSTIPFENLDLHYHPSYAHVIDQIPFFDKVTKRIRGGYCLQLNYLFSILLQTLGYDVLVSAGRVANSIEGKFGGFTHRITIVTLENQMYLVDVGFGGTNILCPMPLIDGYTTKMIGDEEARIVNQPIKYSKTKQPIWQYHYRYKPNEEWIIAYCFTLLEFFKEDFKVGNYYTSTYEDVLFTNNLLAVKLILKEGVPVARLSLLNDRFKLKTAGRVEILRECKTEQERIDGLKEYFGIELTEEEIEAIKGRKVALSEVKVKL